MHGAVALTLALAAHGTSTDGMVPFVKNGAFAGGGIGSGLVVVDGADPFFTCELATAPRVYAYQNTNDAVLAASSEGLFSTEDGGCTFAPVDTDGGKITELVPAHDAPFVIYAVADDGDADRVLVSVDDGATFATVLTAPHATVTRVLVSNDGARAWASGVDTNTGAPLAWHTNATDGARTLVAASFWTPPASSDASPASVTLLDLDGANVDATGDVAVIAALGDDAGNSALVRVDAALSAIEARVDVDGFVRDSVVVNGARLVLTADRRLWSQPSDGASLVALAGGPFTCLLTVPGDARVWACGNSALGAAFFSSVDGATWDPALRYDAVELRACPAGSPGQMRCLGTPVAPITPVAPLASSSGCSSAGGAADGAGVLGAACAIAAIGARAVARRRQGRVVL